jgi:hypothetical protein
MKKRRKRGCGWKHKKRTKPLVPPLQEPPNQPPIPPPPPEVPPRAAKVVAISNIIDNASHDLDEDDDDVFMDARDEGDEGDEDTSEFLDAREEVEDVPTIGKLSQMEERLLISLHFRHLGSPPPDKWDGRGGTVSKIASAINFTHEQRRRIKEVIAATYESLTSGQRFDPSKAPRDPNISAKIKDGSKLQGMVADYIESGLSYTLATSFINQLLIASGEVFTVTRSAVYSCVLRMKARTSKITKRPQGSTDPDST